MMLCGLTGQHIKRRTTPLRLMYGKSCHLPVKLEHKAAIKALNYDIQVAGEQRRLQLQELEELRLDAYDQD